VESDGVPVPGVSSVERPGALQDVESKEIPGNDSPLPVEVAVDRNGCCDD
jgi:hypothetical protein